MLFSSRKHNCTNAACNNFPLPLLVVKKATRVTSRVAFLLDRGTIKDFGLYTDTHMHRTGPGTKSAEGTVLSWVQPHTLLVHRLVAFAASCKACPKEKKCQRPSGVPGTAGSAVLHGHAVVKYKHRGTSAWNFFVCCFFFFSLFVVAINRESYTAVTTKQARKYSAAVHCLAQQH